MKNTIELVATVVAVITWLAGVVLSKGMLSTLFAICFPPYAWYLVVEKVMQFKGWV